MSIEINFATQAIYYVSLLDSYNNDGTFAYNKANIYPEDEIDNTPNTIITPYIPSNDQSDDNIQNIHNINYNFKNGIAFSDEQLHNIDLRHAKMHVDESITTPAQLVYQRLLYLTCEFCVMALRHAYVTNQATTDTKKQLQFPFKQFQTKQNKVCLMRCTIAIHCPDLVQQIIPYNEYMVINVLALLTRSSDQCMDIGIYTRGITDFAHERDAYVRSMFVNDKTVQLMPSTFWTVLRKASAISYDPNIYPDILPRLDSDTIANLWNYSEPTLESFPHSLMDIFRAIGQSMIEIIGKTRIMYDWPSITADEIQNTLGNVTSFGLECDNDDACTLPLPHWIRDMFSKIMTSDPGIAKTRMKVKQVVGYFVFTALPDLAKDFPQEFRAIVGGARKDYPRDPFVTAVVFQMAIGHALHTCRTQLKKATFWQKGDGVCTMGNLSAWAVLVNMVYSMNGPRFAMSSYTGFLSVVQAFDVLAFSFVGGYLAKHLDTFIHSYWRKVRLAFVRMTMGTTETERIAFMAGADNNKGYWKTDYKRAVEEYEINRVAPVETALYGATGVQQYVADSTDPSTQGYMSGYTRDISGNTIIRRDQDINTTTHEYVLHQGDDLHPTPPPSTTPFLYTPLTPPSSTPPSPSSSTPPSPSSSTLPLTYTPFTYPTFSPSSTPPSPSSTPPSSPPSYPLSPGTPPPYPFSPPSPLLTLSSPHSYPLSPGTPPFQPNHPTPMPTSSSQPSSLQQYTKHMQLDTPILNPETFSFILNLKPNPKYQHIFDILSPAENKLAAKVSTYVQNLINHTDISIEITYDELISGCTLFIASVNKIMQKDTKCTQAVQIYRNLNFNYETFLKYLSPSPGQPHPTIPITPTYLERISMGVFAKIPETQEDIEECHRIYNAIKTLQYKSESQEESFDTEGLTWFVHYYYDILTPLYIKSYASKQFSKIETLFQPKTKFSTAPIECKQYLLNVYNKYKNMENIQIAIPDKAKPILQQIIDDIQTLKENIIILYSSDNDISDEYLYDIYGLTEYVFETLDKLTTPAKTLYDVITNADNNNITDNNNNTDNKLFAMNLPDTDDQPQRLNAINFVTTETTDQTTDQTTNAVNDQPPSRPLSNQLPTSNTSAPKTVQTTNTSASKIAQSQPSRATAPIPTTSAPKITQSQPSRATAPTSTTSAPKTAQTQQKPSRITRK